MIFTTKKQQIENLYIDILRRPADASGLKNYLSSNLSIEQIEQALLDSSEYKHVVKTTINDTNILLDVSKQILPGAHKFIDTDNEKAFSVARKHLGEHWVWQKTDIEYNVNELGYRMKEFDDIDWSNYIALFGCSYGAGIGLPYQETYGMRISKDIGADFVNGSVPGCSNDVIFTNVSRLLNSNKPLPRMMIIAWTSMSRVTYWHKGRPETYRVNRILNPWNRSYVNYLEMEREWGYMLLEKKRWIDAVCNRLSIPVLHITSFLGYEFTDDIHKFIYDEEQTAVNINNVEYLNRNVARDVHIRGKHGHPGLSLQDNIYNFWCDNKHRYGFQ